MTRARTGTTEPPSVAFAVGRRCGGAVARNRVRRRLREAVRESGELLEPGHTYLFTAAAPTASATYSDIRDAVRGALEDFGR